MTINPNYTACLADLDPQIPLAYPAFGRPERGEPSATDYYKRKHLVHHPYDARFYFYQSEGRR